MANDTFDKIAGAGPDPTIELKFDDSGLLNAQSFFENYGDMAKYIQDMLDKAEKTVKKTDSTVEGMTEAFKEIRNINAENQKQIDLANQRQAKMNALIKERNAAEEAGQKGQLEAIDKLIAAEKRRVIREDRAKKIEDHKKEKEEKEQIKKDRVDDVKWALNDLAEGLTEAVKSEDGLLKGVLNAGKIFANAMVSVKTDLETGQKRLDASNLMAGVTAAVNNFRKQIDEVVGTIAGYKMAWDTRLLGSEKNHGDINKLVKNAVGVSPFIKQTEVFAKLDKAIDSGIAYNVEYRSYLDVLSDNIATTFEAFNSTLDEIIRIQQQDSTAYRLGMEASLNEYLNKMFENTEYLSEVSDQVTSSLYQATSLLDASQSIEFEFQAQKWLGSLYSVGMGSNSISSIASAIGALASGDISATESGAGKLLVMAASNAGLDYAKMLTDGLDGSELNMLMQSMVFYLQQIADENRIVQKEMAGIFGLQTADIEATQNLAGQVLNIYNSNSTYNTASASSALTNASNSMFKRLDLAGALETVKNNLTFTLAGGIASNPALYLMYSLSNMMSDMDAEIDIPAISVMGNMVDLHTTVADLMRVGAVGGSLMSSLGGLFSGLAQMAVGPKYATSMFEKTAKTGITIGAGYGLTANENEGSLTTTTLVGNSSGDDIIDSQEQQGEMKKAEAADGAEDDSKDMDDLWDLTNSILEILTAWSDGSNMLEVKISSDLDSDNYLWAGGRY